VRAIGVESAFPRHRETTGVEHGFRGGRDSRPRNEAPQDLDNLLDGRRLAGCQLADVDGMLRIVDSAERPGDEIVDAGAVDSHVAGLFEVERPSVDGRFDEAAGDS
jgi:hypothetical protein